MPKVLALAPLIVLAVLAAGVLFLPPLDMKSNLGYEMLNLGESLARNGTFRDALSAGPSGPTAIEPPLYPLFLALCIKVFRDLSTVLLAVTLLTIAAGAATAVL